MAASDKRRRPLEGVRVIDLTKIVAGPNCTRMLATMGAEVIRAEWHDQRALDLLRMVKPHAPGGEGESLNRSGLFNNINPGKYGITLNLSLPQGRELLKKLITKSDVICENYSPGQMDRWELGHKVLREINPKLIYLQISGMGKSGTYDEYVSVGPTAQALSGLTHMSGLPDPMPPAGWGYSYLDHSTGYYGAMLVMAALIRRKRIGEGCYIDLSQTEVGVMTTGTAILEAQLTGDPTARHGNRAQIGGWAPHGAYRCRGDDEWVAIAIQNDREWNAFVEALGASAWAKNPKFAEAADRKANEDELDHLIQEFTKDQDRYELMNRLQQRGVSAAAVQTAQDRCERDPHLQHRGYFVPLPHSEIGTWPIEGFPARFESMRVEVGGLPGRGAPVIGEDNDHVYREILGLSDAEVATLKEEWVI
jgi:crotonobetainyl-CoA:carnitine CoA-transferase CaiB-like acyl-CoA transferase